MASEMRRAARALVERHPQVVRSDYPPEEASRRLGARITSGALGDGIAGEASPDAVRLRSSKGEEMFVGAWKSGEAGMTLEGEFLPPRSTQRLLQGFAIGLSLLIIATAWTFLGDSGTGTRVSTALFTLFAVLAFPYVILGLSSQRSGREAAIARVMQRALAREIR